MNIRILLSLLGALTLSACLSQSTPPQTRWFLPEVPTIAQPAAERSQELRVLPVSASSHLRGGMVWRLSDVEIFIEEQENWGATPVELVTSTVRSAFFEGGVFTPASNVAAPTLALDVRAFEGLYGDPDTARIEIFAVHSSDDLIRQKLFRVTLPLESRDGDALARGMGSALAQIATEIRDWAATSE